MKKWDTFLFISFFTLRLCPAHFINDQGYQVAEHASKYRSNYVFYIKGPAGHPQLENFIQREPGHKCKNQAGHFLFGDRESYHHISQEKDHYRKEIGQGIRHVKGGNMML